MTDLDTSAAALAVDDDYDGEAEADDPTEGE